MHSCRGALPSPVGADAAMQKIDHNQCLRLTRRLLFFRTNFDVCNVRSKASRQRETLISNGTQRPDDPHHNKTKKNGDPREKRVGMFVGSPAAALSFRLLPVHLPGTEPLQVIRLS